MKNRTKKIIAVIVAVLFTLTFIGAIIVSVIAPKNNAVTASADTGDIITYSTEIPTVEQVTKYRIVGCYKMNIPSDLPLSSSFTWTASSRQLILIKGLACKQLQFASKDGKLSGILASLSNGSSFSNTEIFISNGWVENDFAYWCFYGAYNANIFNLVRNFGVVALDTQGYTVTRNEFYNEGHTAGYTEGYDSGHTAGYEEGYDVGFEDGLPQGYDTGYNDGEADGYNKGLSKGHSDRITDPVTSFLQPVHEFMNTKFFGDLTYATIFNIILFVAVATIFIKMFSGG